MRIALIAGLACFMACEAARAAEPEGDLGHKAQEVLVRHCTKCHGKVNPQSKLSVLDLPYLTGNGYVVPGKLNDSQMWERITTNDDSLRMPPVGKLTDEEKGILQKWIEGGAPSFGAPIVPQRGKISTVQMWQSVEKDLRKFPPEDQQFLRYFSITHLHNNPGVSDRDLRYYRAALVKLANSLSWEPDIIRLESIDEPKTLFRVHLVKIGWDKDNLWNRLLRQYPYGMSLEAYRDPEVRGMANYVYEVTGSNIPIIRADWFVANAAQPPLYEAMLRLPTGEHADRIIERKLNVDTERDFVRDREIRAGFVKSNVSEHNRLVARHPAAYGAYWKSYDFKTTNDRQNILKFPLGPEFKDNEFNRHAFEADGGELIWNLPNGLQAYLLIDGKGKYIPKGPIDVVFDAKQPLNNKEVINGISCMVCHSSGMQDCTDDVLQGHGLQGTALIKVERLFPKQEALNETIRADRRRFLKALEDCCADYLQVDEDKDKAFDKFPEPVGSIARQYIQDLSFNDVVAELAYDDVDRLKLMLEDVTFKQYGLGVLLQGRGIKRETWDALKDRSSVYQKVAQRLQLGTPERVFP